MERVWDRRCWPPAQGSGPSHGAQAQCRGGAPGCSTATAAATRGGVAAVRRAATPRVAPNRIADAAMAGVAASGTPAPQSSVAHLASRRE